MYRIGQEEIDAVERVIRSRNLFKVNKAYQESMHAEEDLCSYLGTEHSIVMTSGHAALVSALTAAGIGPGDQVIVPAYTYIASAMSVVAVGAIPVIAEIDETLAIDPDDIEKKITPHTKAIMPVHMLGMPCKMDAICEIAKKHGLKVIEDACQAMGGEYKGKKLGTWGDAGAYSYNHFKIISAGEGGALVTNDKELYQKALIYHDSSAVCFFGNQLEGVTIPPFCGNEYRTNEITSAILREQLKKLDGIKKNLKKAKKYMAERLSAKYNVNYTNDFDGDLGMHIQIIASTEEEAKKIVEQGAGSILINSSRHVYSDWEAIMQKRGHLNPLMDPFKFEANRDIIPDYTHDMCPKSLDILSRAVSIPVSPDKTESELDEIINKLLSVE